MRVKTLLFDFANTLSDWREANKWLDQFIPKEMKGCVEEVIDSIRTKAELGQISEFEMEQQIVKALKMSRKSFLLELEKRVTLFEKMWNFMRSKKGELVIAMLTNAWSGCIRRILDKQEKAVFDYIFDSSEIKLVKPDAAAYEFVSMQLKQKPEKVIFVDDREDFIAGAKNVGMQTVLFRSEDQAIRDISEKIEETY